METSNEKMNKALRIGSVRRSEYDSLTEKEQKIYDSIMSHFPNTLHDSAYDKAIQGGVNYQFIYK